MTRIYIIGFFLKTHLKLYARAAKNGLQVGGYIFHYHEVLLPEEWACYIVRFISADECLGLLTRNYYYLSYTLSNHQVKFLVYEELGTIKQTDHEIT